MLTARTGWTIALAFLGAAEAGGVEGAGLRAQSDETVCPRWHARLLSNSSFSLWRHPPSEAIERKPITSLSLLGDYHVSRSAPDARRSSGLRATSGLIIGSLSAQALTAHHPLPRHRKRRGFTPRPAFRTRDAV